VIDVGIYIAEQHGLTSMYQDFDQYGIPYLLLSVVLMILFQDTFFYWAHRSMHWKPLYNLAHKVHHDSIDTSPFTAYSFHPVETIIEALPSAIFSFLLPVHFSALIGYQVVSLVMNVIGHLGYEIIPQSWTTHWLLKWKTPSTHHNMHHSHVNGNYTLYFRFWDVWMGTEFEEYPATLQAVYDRMNQNQPAAIASKESATAGNS
jgi:Delta7-sterol 5-desaturase